MLKSLLKNERFCIGAAFALSLAFFVGALFGRYVKAAPSLDVIESEQYRQSQEVVSEMGTTETVAEVEPEPPKVEYIEKVVMATAYCPCEKCCGKSDGITATGKKATAGRTIAVDPSVIPYGTEVIIDGHTYIAEDTGGAIKGCKIDIFFDSHDEALEFGRRELTIKIKA